MVYGAMWVLSYLCAVLVCRNGKDNHTGSICISIMYFNLVARCKWTLSSVTARNIELLSVDYGQSNVRALLLTMSPNAG